MRTKSGAKDKSGSMWLSALKAALIASAVSLLLVLLFAFVLKQQWLPAGSIGYINTGIKVLSAVAAAVFVSASAPSRAPLWGAVAGAIYIVVTFVVFSLFSGEFRFEPSFLTDIAMCLAAGAVTGIIKNLRAR